MSDVLINPTDIPIVGETQRKASLKAEVMANDRELLNYLLSDPIAHARAVAGGPFAWRILYGRQMGVFYGKNRGYVDELANMHYRFLEHQWRTRHPEWTTPGQFLDSINIPSPPTEEEIDDAWELEIMSDERFLRKHYEGSARKRKGNDMWVKHQYGH